MLPFLGTGFLPAVVALTLYGLPAVLINTYTALREVDRDTVEAARGQGMTDAQIMRRIEVPLALPLIFAGIRTAAVQIVSAATLAAFIGGGGLGELITAGMGVLDMPQLITGALAVATLAAASGARLRADRVARAARLWCRMDPARERQQDLSGRGSAGRRPARPGNSRRRDLRADRAVRLRQDHDHAHRQPADRAERRADRGRGRGRHAGPTRSRCAAASAT